MKNDIRDFIDFKAIEAKTGHISTQWKVNEELPFFKGHFPENPILPAICIIDVSLHLLSLSYAHVSLKEIRVKRSKFMAMVHPGLEVDIVAESGDEKNWKIMWTSSKDQQKLAQVILVI